MKAIITNFVYWDCPTTQNSCTNVIIMASLPPKIFTITSYKLRKKIQSEHLYAKDLSATESVVRSESDVDNAK